MSWTPFQQRAEDELREDEDRHRQADEDALYRAENELHINVPVFRRKDELHITRYHGTIGHCFVHVEILLHKDHNGH